jgi:hypothetical protein
VVFLPKHFTTVNKRRSFTQSIKQDQKRTKSVARFDATGRLSLKGKVSPAAIGNEGSSANGKKGG